VDRRVAHLSVAAKRALVDLMRRRVNTVEADETYHSSIATLLIRLRTLGGVDELSAAYHFDRGALTRWADSAVGRSGLSAVVALDGAVKSRLRELGAHV
jgi:hypothetical protein